MMAKGMTKVLISSPQGYILVSLEIHYYNHQMINYQRATLSKTELWEWDKEEHCTSRTREVTVSRVHIITSVKTYVKCESVQ